MRIKRIEDKIDDLDTKAQSVYRTWEERNSSLSTELRKVDLEIDNQIRGMERYQQEADSVGLSQGWIDKIQKGAINIDKITDEELRKKIEEYQTWYDKAMDCYYAITDLQEKESDLYQQRFENAQQYWDEQIELIDAQRELYKYNKKQGLSSNISKIRDNVDNSLSEVRKLTSQMNKAVDSGKIKKHSEAWYEMKTAIEQAKLQVYEYQSQVAEAINEEYDSIQKLREARQEYASNRGGFFGVRSEHSQITNQIESDQERVRRLWSALQVDAKKNGTDFINSQAYRERLSEIYEAMNNVSDQYVKLIELDRQYYENRKSLNSAYSSITQSKFAKSEAFGDYENVKKYNKEISILEDNLSLSNKEVSRMQKDLDAAVDSGAIKKGSSEWMSQVIAIKEAENAAKQLEVQIEQDKQAAIDLDYKLRFEVALKKADEFIDKLDTINSLLTDEMMYDYNTGSLTDSGMLALVLNNEALEEHTSKLKTYLTERQKIINQYNKGKFGQEKFDEKMAEVDSNINNELKNIQSSRDAILTIIKNQTRAELDALNKVIEARKTALQKKKDYYDYDKTLKNKTKDVQLLQQQIEALNGATNAESRAKKARLEAQLQEQKEELEDTVREHVYEIQTEGLDDLQKQLEDNYNEYVNHISNSMENMSTAIDTAIQTSGNDVSSAVTAIKELLQGMDIPSSTTLANIFGKTVEAGSSEGAGTIDKNGNTVQEKRASSVGSSSSSSSSVPSTAEKAQEKVKDAKTTEPTREAKVVDAAKKTGGTSAVEKASGSTKTSSKKTSSSSGNNNKDGKTTNGFSAVLQAAKDKNFSVAVAGSSTKSGANIQLAKTSGGVSQTFKFTKNSDGTYTITNVKSGMALDVYNGSKDNGANIWQYTPNGSNAQKWKLISNKDGTYSLRNVASGKMLDVYGGTMKGGTNIHSYENNGTLAQKFYLKKKAKGDKFIAKDDWYLTQEQGAEILSTKYGLLTPLSRGDGVVPADMTKTLYNMARDYQKFDSSVFKLGSANIATNNVSSTSYSVGDITLNGGSNGITKADLEEFRQSIINEVVNHITSDLRKWGIKRKM